MSRRGYKVSLLGTNKKIDVIVANYDELALNLKRIAREEFESNDSYNHDSNNFSFISARLANEFEESLKYSVTVYDRTLQKNVVTYLFDVAHNKEITADEITLGDYLGRQQRIFDNKVAHGFNTTNVYQEARYILEEVAELMRAVEKKDDENILEELSDIVIFAYGCAAVAGVGDLDTKIFEKMKINENRTYTQNSEGDFVKTDGQLNE